MKAYLTSLSYSIVAEELQVRASDVYGTFIHSFRCNIYRIQFTRFGNLIHDQPVNQSEFIAYNVSKKRTTTLSAVISLEVAQISVHVMTHCDCKLLAIR